MLKYVLVIVAFPLLIREDNNPPVVKILSPEEGAEYRWHDVIRYTVMVSDKEDGETKFDEIPVNEVLLEVRIESNVNASTQRPDRSPLHAMMKSNCMNCHAFNSKLIGPSYFDISRKYDNADADQLVKRVREGSSGIWGNIVMPTHPELSVEETLKMIKWILDSGDREDVIYYVGTEGAIRLKKPQNNNRSINVVASYLDKSGAEGMDSVKLVVND